MRALLVALTKRLEYRDLYGDNLGIGVYFTVLPLGTLAIVCTTVYYTIKLFH